MNIKEPFQVYVSSSDLDIDGVLKTCYFISTDNLVNQVLTDCSVDEALKLSTVTPLVVYSSLLGVDEIQILAEVCKLVNRKDFILDFINQSSKTGICIFFMDKVSAAKAVKILCDGIGVSKYNIEFLNSFSPL